MKYVALILVLTLSIAGCGKKAAPRPDEGSAQKSPADDPSEQGDVKHKVLSFNLEGLSDKGEKKWDVTGESAEAVTDDEIKMNNVVAKTYGNEGEATIVGRKGTYDKAKNSVRLEQDVKATIENAESFSGDLLNLPGVTGSAAGKKGGDPAGSGKDGDKTTTIITCDGEAEFDYQKNEAVFRDNVKVTSADGDILADSITAYLDIKTKKVKSIVAEGSVRMTRGASVAYSDKATYAEDDKKVILSGQPKVVIEREGSVESALEGK